MIVVIYDITDNKRRVAFAKYYRFGVRVQKSALSVYYPAQNMTS